MSIFQKSIVKKHISSENQEVLKEKWKLFTSYFHNATIQENIHNSKEEQFQEGFLRELFVKILGYTLNPEPNFNLTTEYKNIKDSKKADGAIIINNIVTAVIELKGTGTTDLGKVESQAFNYKNNQHQCVYVITSNFEKLRFYIDNAIEHIEFNLFKLTEEEFQLLYLCLAFKNIENNVPKNIKDESVSQEDVITKKLYNDYSLFKRELHHNLVALNPGNDPLELFQKSQKLLDRFLFIFFAEDRGLLPTNLIFRINKEWQQLREMRIEVSLYDRYKIYFSDLNVGAKVSLPAFSQTASNKKDEFQIYAYNGGLFKEDDELNTLKIDDALLFKHTEKLSNYDFASEVDVNILGHIFENSLNELDEIKAQIEGQEIDKTKTKRKKDGVFYTPKYITKYIVDNTVGKLCNDKKVEFKISEEEYITDKKRNKTTIQNLAAKLSDYRNWLLQITICDPACGSGAFLNQALDFLITEHRYIDELQAKLFGDALVLSDVEGSILENNLFGVDINEESVEIAKLSLWLRTAQPNRKLNDLNSNIKCGNSLIDDIAVVGDKAFNWQNEFEEIFAKGGFDVIIGNPPYGAKISKEDLSFIISKYSDFGLSANLSDTYFSFYALSLKYLLKQNGILGFITPNTWRLIEAAKIFRNQISSSYFITHITQHLEKVFTDATVDCDTLIIKKSNLIGFINLTVTTAIGNYLEHSIKQEVFAKQEYFNLFLTTKHYSLKEKILSQSILVKDSLIVKNGVKPYEKGKGKPAQTAKIMELKPFTSEHKIDDSFSPLIGGSSFNRYKLIWNNDYWIQYGEWLAAPRDKEIFTAPEKLIFRQTSDSIIGTLVSSKYIMRDNTHIILSNNSKFNLKYILAILNSSLTNWFYWTINPEKGEAMAQVKAFHLGLLPIKELKIENQINFANKVEELISLNEKLLDSIRKFQRSIQRKYQLKELPAKLENWYLVSYADFVKELAKKKIKLSLSDEAEWEEYFNTESKKALELKSKIDATDKEIDQMVYKLYDLTEEEIKIVEGN